MGKLRKACANCIKYKLACEAKRPCPRCVLHQCECIDVERKPRAARRAKRPRTSLDQCGSDMVMVPVVNTQAVDRSMLNCAHSPTINANQPSRVQTNAPYIPDLVLNDNEPLFSMNNGTDPSSFLLQSPEASILPYSDGFNSSSYLSSVLFPEQGALFNEKLEDTDYKSFFSNGMSNPKLSPTTLDYSLDTTTLKKSSELVKPYYYAPLATPVMNPVNKVPLPHPQPLVVASKNEWGILDCNPEFVQFLGYETVSVFNSLVSKLDQVIAPENVGFGKPSFDYLLKSKTASFEYVGSLKARDGIERTVTLRVDVLERLVIFTVKEVYDVRPSCFYGRWLKSVVPNAITACDRSNCQCKYNEAFQQGLQHSLPQQSQQQLRQQVMQLGGYQPRTLISNMQL